MDEASAVDPPATDVGSSTEEPGAPALAAAAGDRRTGRRGLLTSRKRLALTIDAELTSETGQHKESETRDGEASTPGSASNSDATSSGAAGEVAHVPWWVLEYQCPPPGHLGAHDVSVVVKESSEEFEDELKSTLETEEKSDGSSKQEAVFGRQFTAKPANRSGPEQQTEGPRDLRRRQYSGESIGTGSCIVLDSVLTMSVQMADDPTVVFVWVDYSPSQKRKLVHEHDPSILSPIVVAKDPKHSHEPSDGTSELLIQPQQPSHLTSVVTPSNLVRPLNKIDIHCQRTVPAATVSESAVMSTSHASKSA